jgi:hypothetical protein
MNICDANLALELEVRRFIENVGDVKEESITDFLVWKWRELDKRFRYVRVHPFNHEEESSGTGADFDLELWLVGRSHHVALAVQAKKFLKRTDSYVTRLRYPGGTKSQMNTLLSYASSTNRIPFYFIYSIPPSTSGTMCPGKAGALGAVFMGHARRFDEYADGKHGKRITRDQLLRITNPFHCMFCCPSRSMATTLIAILVSLARNVSITTTSRCRAMSGNCCNKATSQSIFKKLRHLVSFAMSPSTICEMMHNPTVERTCTKSRAGRSLPR